MKSDVSVRPDGKIQILFGKPRRLNKENLRTLLAIGTDAITVLIREDEDKYRIVGLLFDDSYAFRAFHESTARERLSIEFEFRKLEGIEESRLSNLDLNFSLGLYK